MAKHTFFFSSRDQRKEMFCGSPKAIPTENLVEISTSFTAPNKLYYFASLNTWLTTNDRVDVTELLHKFTLVWSRPRLNWMREPSFTLCTVYPWPQSQACRGWCASISSKTLRPKCKPQKLQNDTFHKKCIIIYNEKRAIVGLYTIHQARREMFSQWDLI